MKQLSFRAKIMIVFITIGILQGGIMGYFAYSHARSLIFNNKKNEMENMLEKINISVTDKVSYMTSWDRVRPPARLCGIISTAVRTTFRWGAASAI